MRLVVVLAISAIWPLGAAIAPVNIAWLPVTDAERMMKSPVVDKNAGVEALFWRVHVMDDMSGEDVQRVLYHYVRLKVFNQDGKDKIAALDLRYSTKTLINSISGRTIKADGSIVELGKDAVHERVISRAGGLTQRAKSFAMPGVEVGSIVEYRWKEVRDDKYLLYLPLEFQREYPVQRVTYFVKPLPRDYTTYTMSVWPFNCTPAPLKREPDGFNSITLENVPAFREEPLMPGERGIRPWILVYYHNDNSKREPEKYWSGIGKKAYSDLKQALRTNGELKEAAAQATAGAKNDEEKVLCLIRYIRANVRNLFDRTVTDAERGALIKKMPRERYRTAAEVFKSRIGTSDEMNTLFAALAAEAGLEARPAMISSRDDFLFDERMTEKYFLRNIDMAVMIDGKWKVYDISARLLPSGMLVWQEEGERALLADPKNPEFIAVPVAHPDASLSSRTAKLNLSEDGAIEGDIQESWTGHSAFDRRVELDGESAANQVEHFKGEIVKAYPQAEVDDLKLENADDAEKPLKLSYHVRIPGYAARTGKRIFFQPLFFQRNESPLLSSTDRKYDIHFRYAWHELDQVTVTFPPGFELEKPERPSGMNFGEPGSYEVSMSVRAKTELVCKRELTFGREQFIFYPSTAYAQIKNLFDAIHTNDSHKLALIKVSGGME